MAKEQLYLSWGNESLKQLTRSKKERVLIAIKIKGVIHKQIAYSLQEAAHGIYNFKNSRSSPSHVTAKLPNTTTFCTLHTNTTLCSHDAFSCHIKRCESLRMYIDTVCQRILTWDSSFNFLEKPKPSSATTCTDPYIFNDWAVLVIFEINWVLINKVIMFSNQCEAFVYMYSVLFILYFLIDVHFCSQLSGFDLTYSIL